MTEDRVNSEWIIHSWSKHIRLVHLRLYYTPFSKITERKVTGRKNRGAWTSVGVYPLPLRGRTSAKQGKKERMEENNVAATPTSRNPTGHNGRARPGLVCASRTYNPFENSFGPRFGISPSFFLRVMKMVCRSREKMSVIGNEHPDQTVGLGFHQ